jgi:hypothetical protein
MLGLHFVMQLVQQAWHSFAAVFRAPPDRADPAERDALLRSKFRKFKKRIVRRLNVIMPNTDHSNALEVVAVMPTASFETRVNARYKQDTCVWFCTNKMSRHDEEQFMNAQNAQWFLNLKIAKVFCFSSMTNSDCRDRFLRFLLVSGWHSMPPEILKLIFDEYAQEHHTDFMVFWMGPGKRRRWMHFGMNTLSDNNLELLDTMRNYHDMSNNEVQIELAS